MLSFHGKFFLLQYAKVDIIKRQHLHVLPFTYAQGWVDDYFFSVCR